MVRTVPLAKRTAADDRTADDQNRENCPHKSIFAAKFVKPLTGSTVLAHPWRHRNRLIATDPKQT